MRFSLFSFLGAFLFVAVFGPFALMLAGPALTGDPDAARVGLYLLLNVNPVAIPVLLVLLGATWVSGFWMALPVLPTSSRPLVAPVPSMSSMPDAVVAPGSTARACRPDIAPSKRRATDHHDVVIDVVAVQSRVRPIFHSGLRLPPPVPSRPALPFQASSHPLPR